jgi:hypothetical protein
MISSPFLIIFRIKKHMKKPLALTLILLAVVVTASFAQTSKFFGMWELMRPPGAESGNTPVLTILRNYDEKGNYTQLTVISAGSFIERKANFTVVDDSTVKETIDYSRDPNRTGSVLTFGYRFIAKDDAQFMITEGGTKVVDGFATVEWREVWRKVEAYKAN